MRPLLIIGASGHGRVIADAARAAGGYLQLGFVDKTLPPGSVVDGLRVLGDDSDIPRIVGENPGVQAIVGIGCNRTREDIVAKATGLAFCTVVHPAATIAPDVEIGPGSFVAASATINCGSTIGAHAVVNTGACVDHDCRIGDFGFVSPGATLAGSVDVGPRAFVGSGATVLPNIAIGQGAVVGAGAAVIRPVDDGVTVVGVPARPLPDGKRR